MPGERIEIDGSRGEGGGQILRTSLALSLVTGQPFRISSIRAGRPKPGLLRQHLTAVTAAAAISGARVEGAALGSRELSFEPGAVKAGEYRFAVGTAGSVTLVLQTVLPALALARGPSSLVLEGGTHNPFAPPWDFLERCFLPLLARMGPRVATRLARPGFYPAGGGSFSVDVEPVKAFTPLVLAGRGAVKRRRARALVANLPVNIAHRELATVARRLGLAADDCLAERVPSSAGPGNVVMVEVEADHVTEIFTGFGQKGRSAETVAGSAAAEASGYLAAGAAVGPYLADQLLVPLAIAGEGRFTTVEPTGHTTTNIEVIRRFMGCEVAIVAAGDGVFDIGLRRPAGSRGEE